jgi:hypothetical protein
MTITYLAPPDGSAKADGVAALSMSRLDWILRDHGGGLALDLPAAAGLDIA